jgi:hypothetical protein
VLNEKWRVFVSNSGIRIGFSKTATIITVR